MFEEFGGDPAPTQENERRLLAAFGLSNHRDAVSSSLSGTADFKLFELRLHASQRFFLQAGDAQAQFVENDLSQARSTVGAEIARYAISSRGVYGRFALGFLNFLPSSSKQRWIQLGLNTGILTQPDLPWSTHLHLGFHFPIHPGQSLLDISLRTSRMIADKPSWALEFGGMLHWSYRIFAQEPKAVANYEHMLFSVGPVMRLRTSMGTGNLFMLWRLWIDKEITASNVFQPSELRAVPDLSFSWTLKF